MSGSARAPSFRIVVDMRVLRAVVFNFLFYALSILAMLLALPLLLLPRLYLARALRALLKTLGCLERVFGIRIAVEGEDNLPQGGCLIAAKHQSMWETFMLLPLLADAGFVYKKELGKIPLFGTYLRRLGMIEIDRAQGAKTLREMAKQVSDRLMQGRQVIIFPEGTRRPPGSPAHYKTGIALLYKLLDRPVVPLAHNSGLLWSNYFWRGVPGVIRVKILRPIPSGLSRDAFMDRLVTDMETASNELLIDSSPLRSERHKASA